MLTNGSLTIGNPDHPLVEAGAADSVGVPSASVALTLSGAAGYDLTNWTQLDATHWSRAATYGSAVLDTSANTLTYNLDNYRPATQLLRDADAPTDAVTVGLTDGSSAQAVFTIDGRNDAPSLAASSGGASGQLAFSDPDRLSTVLLSVQGGTFTYTPQPFHFTMDSFSVTRDGASVIADDFNGTALSSAYRLNGGTPSEAGGRLVFDSSAGAPISAVGTVQPLSGFIDTLSTNTTAGSTAGLREANAFQVSGVFDLTLPGQPRQLYGIRLTDATSTVVGNDIVELDVRQDPDGTNHVEIRGVDQITNATVTLASTDLGPVSAGDQIALHLNHSTPGTDAVTASFEIIHGGVAGATQTLATTVHIFHGEDYTRAAINAYGRVDTSSSLDGQYGTLRIDQTGTYTFTPNAAAQALPAGQAVNQGFTVVATDDQGATGTQAVVVTVVGTGTGTPPTTLATRGQVADGYVSGATVFADANGNGILDPNEVSTTTDASGAYTLNGGTGPLVATGGTDISTGLPSALTLSAPAGATVITPLTTLVQALGGTAAAAGMVAAAFGLSSNINVTTFDPVAGAASGSADGRAAYLASVAVADTAAILSSALAGQGAGAAAAQAAVIGQLAAAVGGVGQGGTLDLTSATVVGGVLASASSQLGVGLDARVTAAVSEIAAVSNTTLAGSTATGQALLDQTAATAATAQGTTSQSLQAAHGDPGQVQAVLAAASTLSVGLAHDTGASGTDHVTADATLAVAQAAAGTTLHYVVDGVAAASYDPSSIADGTHTVSVTQTDSSGAVTADGGLSFTLDRTAPTLTVSGVSGASNLVDGHVLSGTVDLADAGAQVTISDGSSVLGTVQSDAQGHFSVALDGSAFGPGHSYALTAAATDLAGNTGSSDSFTFTLDYTPNQAAFGTVAHDAASAAGQVYALYEGLLGRAPDALGGEGWADALAKGTSLHDVTQAMLSASEVQTHLNAPGNAAFVEQVYETVLGRHGDAAGAAAWTAALDSGLSRADFVDAAVFSTEHLAQLQPALQAGVFVADATASGVARLYYGLLDRAPDAAGLQTWVAAEHAGSSLHDIAQAFLSSPEYGQQHPGAQTDAQFVESLYANALGRQAEPAGLQAWTDGLAHGLSRVDVATAISEGSEAQLHLSGQVEQGWHLA